MLTGVAAWLSGCRWRVPRGRLDLKDHPWIQEVSRRWVAQIFIMSCGGLMAALQNEINQFIASSSSMTSKGQGDCLLGPVAAIRCYSILVGLEGCPVGEGNRRRGKIPCGS